MSTKISDSFVGSPNIYGQSAIKEASLGTIARSGDGRAFRYVLAGGSALVQGKLHQSAAESAANWEALAVGAVAIGGTKITVSTSTTVAADALAGGYLVVSTSTGIGYTYKIAGNTATSAAAGLVITLDDPLIEAIAATTTVDAIPNPGYKVELWDYTNHDGVPVGVAIYPIAAGFYGWVQTGGPCGVLVDSGNLAVGVNAYASAAVDGAVHRVYAAGRGGDRPGGGMRWASARR